MKNKLDEAVRLLQEMKIRDVRNTELAARYDSQTSLLSAIARKNSEEIMNKLLPSMTDAIIIEAFSDPTLAWRLHAEAVYVTIYSRSSNKSG